jgi:hypothetical protein
MSPEQTEDSRLIRGMMFGFLLSVPLYLILGLLGVAGFYLGKLVFG